MGIDAIFGSGGYEAPAATEYKPMPVRNDSEPEEASVRDAERRKLRARAGGVRSTLLSSTLGKVGGQAGTGAGLLGRTLQS